MVRYIGTKVVRSVTDLGSISNVPTFIICATGRSWSDRNDSKQLEYHRKYENLITQMNNFCVQIHYIFLILDSLCAYRNEDRIHYSYHIILHKDYVIISFKNQIQLQARSNSSIWHWKIPCFTYHYFVFCKSTRQKIALFQYYVT